MEGPAFTKYSAEVLPPEVEPGTLVLPDNFSPHKLNPAQMASEEAGGWVLLLPPYRRDLPPMEMAFAKLMNHLTSGGAPTFTDVFDALAQAWELYSHHQGINSFRHARYASTSLKIALSLC